MQICQSGLLSKMVAVTGLVWVALGGGGRVLEGQVASLRYILVLWSQVSLR